MATTIPSFTFNSAGNVKSSASLSASATGNQDVDYSAVIGARVVVKNTPGGSVAATRGVRIDVFVRYGSGPATAVTAWISFTMPSAAASTAEDLAFDLPPGKYNIKWTNLDASNAVTLEITGDTWVISTT